MARVHREQSLEGGKASLVDVAEEALRRWLATGPPPRRRAAAARAGAVRPARHLARHAAHRARAARAQRRDRAPPGQRHLRRRGRLGDARRGAGEARLLQRAGAPARRAPGGRPTCRSSSGRSGAELGRLFDLDADTPATTVTPRAADGRAAGRAHERRRAPRRRAAARRRSCAASSSAGRWCSTCCSSRACRWPTTASRIQRARARPRRRDRRRAGREGDDRGARDRARDLHGGGRAGRALERHLPAAQPRPARGALARGRAAGARDRRAGAP